MSNKGATGVIDAIKGKSAVGGAKKGVGLLAIVQKLSAKRKTQKDKEGKK
jgi:hypothetical protein